MKRLVRNLKDNSIEAFILALETINRPTISYRAEAFCFFFCNSWELLMKAKLLNDGQKIYYPKKKNKPRRSISIEDCLNKVFTSDNHPVKINIKKIYDFRCEATHLVIPFVPSDIMGLFQAGVINYPKALREWFGINLSDRIPLGMMVLIYDFDPKQHSLEHAKITRKLPAETVNWLMEFQSDIRKQAALFGETAQQYYVPIDLKLAIIKNPDKADIVLSSGVTGKEAIIIEVPKDPNKTHPYRRKEVVLAINQRLGNQHSITNYDIVCINRVFDIKSKGEFYYLPKFYPSPRYSDTYIDWIVSQATKNPNFFSQTRRKAQKENL
jgi:hypothetical protein